MRFCALACFVINNLFRLVLGVRGNYGDYRHPCGWL